MCPGPTRLRLGTVYCAPAAGAGGCRVTIAGTLKVGGRAVTLTVTRTLAAGVTGTFTLPLTTAAKRALAGSRRGSLRLRPVVRGRYRHVGDDGAGDAGLSAPRGA